MASIMAGREGRGTYGSRKGRLNEFASTTNREKSKHKNPMMLKQRRAARERAALSSSDRKVCIVSMRPHPFFVFGKVPHSYLIPLESSFPAPLRFSHTQHRARMSMHKDARNRH